MRFWRRICIQYDSFCIDILKSVVLYSNFTSKMHTLRHFLRVYPEKCRTVFKFYCKNRKIQKKWIQYSTFGDPYAKNDVLYSNSTSILNTLPYFWWSVCQKSRTVFKSDSKMNTLRHFLACISEKCCTVFKFHTKNASILNTHVRKVL